jgi:hypothetical protein
VLDVLLSRDFPGRAELAQQAETVRTGGSACSCGCPSFSLIADRTLPAANVSYANRMVSDAHGTDPAGNAVGVLLFTDEGYLDDVEIYSVESITFAGLPRPETLTLDEWSEPDANGTRWLQNPPSVE